jgi:hypothetical protein
MLPLFLIDPRQAFLQKWVFPMSAFDWTTEINDQTQYLIHVTRVQGWIQHDLVGERGVVLFQLWCELCWSWASPAHQLAWLLYLNCNCCSQFAYHHVITQIIVSHFASNIFFALWWKIATPLVRAGGGGLGQGNKPGICSKAKI